MVASGPLGVISTESTGVARASVSPLDPNATKSARRRLGRPLTGSKGCCFDDLLTDADEKSLAQCLGGPFEIVLPLCRPRDAGWRRSTGLKKVRPCSFW